MMVKEFADMIKFIQTMGHVFLIVILNRWNQLQSEMERMSNNALAF